MKGMSLSTGRLVLFALLGAILVGLQVAMAALPNVEAVSLLVMVYTVVFGGAVAYILCVFVVLEMLIWGAGTWVISYLYVWAVLAVLAWALRKMDSRLGWAILSGGFGLAFGALCALVYLPVGGFRMFAAGYPAAPFASSAPGVVSILHKIPLDEIEPGIHIVCPSILIV